MACGKAEDRSEKTHSTIYSRLEMIDKIKAKIEKLKSTGAEKTEEGAHWMEIHQQYLEMAEELERELIRNLGALSTKAVKDVIEKAFHGGKYD